MNTFIRNYVTNPALDSSGEPIGGCWGFLRTLQKLVREIDPSKVFIVWDGDGGSSKRRSVTKQYKDGRKPLKLNRAYDNMSTIDETQNRYNQMLKTIDYLNEMPVVQLMADGVEADDVIGYLCKYRFKTRPKVILSSDHDYYQLLDNLTIIYSPTLKAFVNEKFVIDKFGIHPSNFALAKAIVGDNSDNIPGVPGAGFKTLVKEYGHLFQNPDFDSNRFQLFVENSAKMENSKKKIYDIRLSNSC